MAGGSPKRTPQQYDHPFGTSGRGPPKKGKPESPSSNLLKNPKEYIQNNLYFTLIRKNVFWGGSSAIGRNSFSARILRC